MGSPCVLGVEVVATRSARADEALVALKDGLPFRVMMRSERGACA